MTTLDRPAADRFVADTWDRELVPALQAVWDTVGLVHHITELTGQIRSL